MRAITHRAADRVTAPALVAPLDARAGETVSQQTVSRSSDVERPFLPGPLMRDAQMGVFRIVFDDLFSH